MTMSASETLVVETAARVLADLADPQTVVQKRDNAWKAPLWSSLQEKDWTSPGLPRAPAVQGRRSAMASASFARPAARHWECRSRKRFWPGGC
jgi:hypothetical protein